MRVHVKLHGILRDKLPAEWLGQVSLELAAGAIIVHLVAALAERGIARPFEIAVNGDLTEDDTLPLPDEARIDIFRAGAGG